MKRTVFTFATMLVILAGTPPLQAHSRARWSAAAANAWYAKQPWPLGSNYVPSDAINQLEMWQAATFDTQRIDVELGWAQALGMNTMRVFLHNLLWQQDPQGFQTRIRAFLRIAARHHIKPIFVLFDSDWDPDPRLGPQHPPIPGVHNSGWVQAPGAALDDPSQYPKFKAYVRGIVGAFANDDRILAWDVWNEPDNAGDSKFAAHEPKDKLQRVEYLLPRVFAWARSVHPIQPLTSGLSAGDDWSRVSDRHPVERTQLLESDILSFHNYGWSEEFEARIGQLMVYGRPIVCTEYMARGNGSTIDGDLPIGKLYGVGMINWGLVEGKTQTTLPWNSWQRPYTLDKPMVWFHDLLHADGTPYREREAQLLRALSAAPKGVVPARIWLPSSMPAAAREDHAGTARALRARGVTDVRIPEPSRNPR